MKRPLKALSATTFATLLTLIPGCAGCVYGQVNTEDAGTTNVGDGDGDTVGDGDGDGDTVGDGDGDGDGDADAGDGDGDGGPVVDGGDGDGDGDGGVAGDGGVDGDGGPADAGGGDLTDGGPAPDGGTVDDGGVIGDGGPNVAPQNASPQVSILNPGDGDVFALADTVDFAASAFDPEDGLLDGTSVVWTSDQAVDPLGEGAVLSNISLAGGTHEVTVTVTDAAGATASDSVTVLVYDDLPPDVRIQQPTDGAYYAADDNIRLRAQINDEEDGNNLDGETWTVDGEAVTPDGQDRIGTLPVGDHVIVLTFTDSGGNTVTIEATIHVVDNLPPACAIDVTGETFGLPGFTTTFTGSCTDPEDGDIDVANLAWADSIDGDLGAGETIMHTFNTPGTHAVSLCAADPSDGAIVGCSTVAITVVEAICGDGERGPGEACDLGAANNVGHFGGCNADCTLAPLCPADTTCESCIEGETCTPACTDGACVVQCAENADCAPSTTADGTSLEVTCADTDSCDVSCIGDAVAGCTVYCLGGADCELTCEGATAFPCECLADPDSDCNVQAFQ